MAVSCRQRLAKNTITGQQKSLKMKDQHPRLIAGQHRRKKDNAEEVLQPGVERERIKRKHAWEEIAAKYRNIRDIHQKGKVTGARKKEKNHSRAGLSASYFSY